MHLETNAKFWHKNALFLHKFKKKSAGKAQLPLQTKPLLLFHPPPCFKIINSPLSLTSQVCIKWKASYKKSSASQRVLCYTPCLLQGRSNKGILV